MLGLGVLCKFVSYVVQATCLSITSFVILVLVRFFPLLARILKSAFRKADVLLIHRFKQTLLRRHWDVQVNDNRFYSAVASKASLGLGDTYVQGWWESPNLQDTLWRIVNANMDAHPLQRWHHHVFRLKHQLFYNHSPKTALRVGFTFYDKNSPIFKIMLDPSMTYSSAYWTEGVTDLESAQRNKMELIARKLKLKPGMRVLDLGCGYGGLMKFLAQTQKVSVEGCTVSEEEAKYARESCAGLDEVEIVVSDYRDLLKKKMKAGEWFDRVVCIGMLEHVGHEGYRGFFKLVRSVLRDEGLLLVETMGQSESVMPLADPWICSRVMENFVIPYHTMLPRAADDLFIIEDWQNARFHLYKTMNAWIDNFHLNFHRISHRVEKAEKFHRKWSYLLQNGASALRARKLHCWQIVFSKGGCEKGYDFQR